MMKPSMSALPIALLLCLASPAHAERRRAVAPPVQSLSVEFIEIPGANFFASAGSDAWMDLGATIGRDPVSGYSTRARQRVGIRIVRAGGLTWGTAGLTARLQVADSRAVVRVDGKPINAVPVVVSTHAAIGAVIVHIIEIDVPASAPEGPLTASIAWEATAP
jgi:hypothetical protein